MKLPPASLPAFPEVNQFIYAFWDETSSGDKCGWYLAKIVSISEKGEARLKYRRGCLVEDVALDDIDLVLAKGNGKWFLSPTETPPPMATSFTCAVYSTPHKVKGYVDDLTIIASTKKELQDVVSHADGWCCDICLHIRPDKCFTLLLVGGKAVNGVISVGGSKTSNI